MAEPTSPKSGLSTRAYSFDQRQAVLFGAASARSAPITSGEVMLHASAACHFTVGDDTVEADSAANTMPMSAGERFHLQISPGQHVAVIQNAAGGTLTIIPINERS